ncbi:phage holin family protein [Candidatus Saccharibacteria bacterium]|nr:phage holin family protein [Candidatus Saccharibacteria bacterium]
MLRLLARFCITLIGNAIGLLIAAFALSGLSIDTLSFVVVVVVFTIIEIILGPLLEKIATANVPAMSGGIALVTAFVGLFLTNLFLNGLTITGLSTWIIAPLIIWVCTVLAAVILPLFLFKKTLRNRIDNNQ